ncbi:hypothetical protein SR39_07425, partial [Methylobacterium radiotolerans]
WCRAAAPSRTRPGRAGAGALGDAEATRLAGAPPDRDGLAAWLDAVVDAAEARRQGNPSRAATGDAVLRRALEAVLRYAVSEGGTEAVARLADRRRPTAKTPRATSAWPGRSRSTSPCGPRSCTRRSPITTPRWRS